MLAAVAGLPVGSQEKKEERLLDPIVVKVTLISSDQAVKYDYDIVYVRTPRKGDKARSTWTEIAHPAIMDAQGDLMLLHPDGTEELLVAGGADGSVTDPYVPVRWPMGLLLASQGAEGDQPARSAAVSSGGGPLQD